MEITSTPILDKSQVELKITVTAEELEPYVDRAVKSLSTQRPIKGFRPGKVSLDVARTSYGEQAILEEALDKGLPRWFVQAILEYDIEALGRPATTIEKLSLTEGVAFTATVDVLPKVELGDPATITVSRRSQPVTDEQIDQELTYLAKTRSTFIEVSRPAQLGDTVIVDFDVLKLDGSRLEGGASKQHPVHLGEGHFIPDFEQKIQGMSASDEREFDMTFPADYPREELRNQTVKARVKAHTVQKRVTPEINDTFAQGLGQFKDLPDLKAKIKANLEHERSHHDTERLQSELIEKLAEISTFSALPDSLIEREIDRRLHELVDFLSMQQKSLDQYLAETKKTPEQLRQELREPAIRTVKVSLALRTFAQDHKIEVPDKEVEAEIQEFLKRYASTKDADVANIDQEELRTSVINTLRNRKALAQLESLVKIKEETRILSH